MSGVDFLDSNVFIYVLDNRSPAKQAIARRVLEQAHTQHTGVISFQVVQETLSLLTSKFRVVAREVDRHSFLKNVLVPLWQVMPSDRLYARALDVQTNHGFDFYDSLIVAAALEAGCTQLLTEDLQHGQHIEKRLTITNPFLAAA